MASRADARAGVGISICGDLPNKVRRITAPTEARTKPSWDQLTSFYAGELTGSRTNRVSVSLTFLRKEVRHRQVPLACVVIEGQDSRPIAEVRKFLFDARECSARRNADQQAFF